MTQIAVAPARTLGTIDRCMEAMTMGDRIAVLNAGVLQQYGRPEELYTRPVNLFVARFIGSPEMNLYQAAADQSGALVLGSQRVTLGPLTPAPAPFTPGNPITPGQPVTVGVRPEDLAPVPRRRPRRAVRRRPRGRAARQRAARVLLDRRAAG